MREPQAEGESPMECFNCKITNEPDSRYCRKCGVSIRRCGTCAVALEADALYCRRCGRPAKQSQEDRAAAAQETPERGSVNTPDFDGDVDFTTKITPRRVEPIPGAANPRRLTRAAVYIAMLLTVVTLTAMVTTWRSTGVPSTEAAEQVEALRADLEEYKRMVGETKDADRRAILQEIGLVLVKVRADERKATNEEIRKAIAIAKEDERKLLNQEISKAIAKAKEQDHSFIIAELTRLKAKAKNREFTRQLEKTIALFKTNAKPGANTRRAHDG
jgi:ferredoxin